MRNKLCRFRRREPPTGAARKAALCGAPARRRLRGPVPQSRIAHVGSGHLCGGAAL